jgi:hypothetical protein
MARSTSRRTWGESFAWAEKIRTMSWQESMPLMMAAPHSLPGRMSRGAIQQRRRRASRTAQAASAQRLSAVE